MTAIVGLWRSYSRRRDHINSVLLRSYYKGGRESGVASSLSTYISSRHFWSGPVSPPLSAAHSCGHINIIFALFCTQLIAALERRTFVLRRLIQRESVVGQVVGRSALGDVFHKILPPGLWAFPHGRPLSHGSLSYSAGLRPSLASVDRHGPVLPRQMLKVLSFVAGPFRLMVYCLG